jgi:hypothetical protein
MTRRPLVPADISDSWWPHAGALAQAAERAAGPLARGSFRFGDVVADVDGTYSPLLEELHDAYGDCAVADSDPAARIGCSARVVPHRPSLLALRFQVPPGLPHLAELALSVIRHRTDLQHFSIGDLGVPGWRWIENTSDHTAPLLAASDNTALLDLRVAPPEFIVNLIVGVAQVAQPSILFVHAGGVSIDGRGALLVGASGSGKSTTTVSLACRGHPMFGDETVGLRIEPPEIVALRRTVKLRPGPRPAALAARLRSVTHGTRVDAHGIECAWIRPAALLPDSKPLQSAALGDVFFLRTFGARAFAERFVPSLEHLDQLRALTMTLSAVVSWPSSAAGRLVRFSRLVDLFSRCRCYHLDLGAPDETAALIENTVRNHAT